MDLYLIRLHPFFIHSLCFLFQQSGVQRWHSISDDILSIYADYLKHISYQSMSEYHFRIFLEGGFMEDTSESSLLFKDNLQHESFQNFMFSVLHAFLDPPSSWWHKIQEMYQSSSKDNHIPNSR